MDMAEKKLRGDVPEVCTIAEVAEMFGRKPRTVRAWIADGLLPHLKIGRSVFVPADALAKMVANAATKAAGKPPKADVAKATAAAVPKPRDDNALS
jgi:excisionase family DNA binding protein